MNKIVLFLVCIFLVTLIAGTQVFSNSKASLDNAPTEKLTANEAETLFQEIWTFYSPYNPNIVIEIPINGRYENADVMTARPYFIKNGERKQLSDSVVYYEPWSNIQGWRNPVTWTKDGKAVLLLQGEQSGVYLVDNEGHLIELKSPLDQVFVVATNPNGLQVALMGTEGYDPVNVAVYLVNLETNSATLGYKYAVDPDAAGEWLGYMSYASDGTLYFDVTPSQKSSIYSLSPTGSVSLIEQGAYQPKVSPDGKLLAYIKLDNRYLKLAKDSPKLEVMKIGGGELGSISAWGLISWGDNQEYLLVQEQTTFKVIGVTDTGVYLNEVTQVEGTPFVVDNRPGDIYVALTDGSPIEVKKVQLGR